MRRYNAVIREGTLRYAVLEQLKYPDKLGMGDVMRAHFKHSKQRILAICDRWLKEAGAAGGKSTAEGLGHKSAMEGIVKEVKKELAKIK